MSDLVVTVSAARWLNWVADGGHSDERRHCLELEKPPIAPGERVYFVAHGRLRGYALLSGLSRWTVLPGAGQWVLHYRGFAACTREGIAVGDFRGFRERWWSRETEAPFTEWRTEGVKIKQPKPRKKKAPEVLPEQATLFGS